MSSKEAKYVKDAHGVVYIYLPDYHADLIGSVLEFCDAPVVQNYVTEINNARTPQEIRELAAKNGLNIPDGTPHLKAIQLYTMYMDLKSVEPVVDLEDIKPVKKQAKTKAVPEPVVVEEDELDDISKAFS